MLLLQGEQVLCRSCTGLPVLPPCICSVWVWPLTGGALVRLRLRAPVRDSPTRRPGGKRGRCRGRRAKPRQGAEGPTRSRGGNSIPA